MSFHSFAFAQEGEGHGGAPPAQGPQKLPEWSDMINKLAALNAKIRQKEDIIKKIIIDKHHSSGERTKELVDSLIVENRELNTMKDQYEKQRMILKYRFPEKLIKEGRKYDRMKIMSVQETEKQVGLDGKLDQSLKKIRSKYGTDIKASEAPKVIKKKEQDSSSFDQSEPILIQK